MEDLALNLSQMSSYDGVAVIAVLICFLSCTLGLKESNCKGDAWKEGRKK